jgi:formylglycine-generating enzyme required for sulfatase activity
VSASAVTIETVEVGDQGNPSDPTTGFGAVGYTYAIGKYEVTNAQYAEFLNAKAKSDPLGLYEPSSGTSPNGSITRSGASGSYVYAAQPNMGTKPVSYISWYDSFRFANWMHNGQGNGDTETGAYTLLGGTAIPLNADSITRNPGATWVLPSENEWYKAAYYQPAAEGGDSDGYWRYPTRSNEVYSDQPPGNDAPTPSKTANFRLDDGLANDYNDGYAVSATPVFDNDQVYVTDVGAYEQSPSFYGTFDQGGNVEERNEAVIPPEPFVGLFNGLRGGSWAQGTATLDATRRAQGNPNYEGVAVGFRLVYVPEPGTLGLAACAAAAGALAHFRRRRCPARWQRAAT